jgi:mannobiose 2-epimerase
LKTIKSSHTILHQLSSYQNDVEIELKNILNWWMENSTNKSFDVFYGEVDTLNVSINNKPIGLVMISRILWTFSASYNHSKNIKYLQFADSVFKYLNNHFIDTEHGGMYWSVTEAGLPHADKKQIYGLAFAIYGLTEYFKATSNNKALSLANELYALIELHSFDKIYGGYIEAFNNDWTNISDVRLSDKDSNEKKSMNTHLHIIEAYSQLYHVNQSEKVKKSIQLLLNNFKTHIIDANTFHQKLFFDENWNCKSNIISFGHDIEAAWLLEEAAKQINHYQYIQFYKSTGISIANETAKYQDVDGAIWYEYNASNFTINKEKHWWPQAEAMVGFFNAFEQTNNLEYLHYSLNSWNYIKNNLIDQKYGEWFWGYDSNGILLQKEKAGFWKCPYHNSRACIEISKRITQLLN